MPIICELVHEGKPVIFVMEILSNDNKSFWERYIGFLKKTSDYKKDGEKIEGTGQTAGKFFTQLSDLRLAVDGFENAISLPPRPGTHQYIAYATFDELSIQKNDDWKALNIQICMTVTGHKDLPLTTHMGIFRSPFGESSELPKEYDSLDRDKFIQNRAQKKVSRLSLLLHSFAFAAYAKESASSPLYMVTKPIKTMSQIFSHKECVVPHETRTSSDKPDLLEFMINRGGCNIGCCVNTSDFEVEIVIKSDGIVKHYRVTQHQELDNRSVGGMGVAKPTEFSASKPSAGSDLRRQLLQRNLPNVCSNIPSTMPLNNLKPTHSRNISILTSGVQSTRSASNIPSNISRPPEASALSHLESSIARININQSFPTLAGHVSGCTMPGEPSKDNSQASINPIVRREGPERVFAPFLWALAFNPQHSSPTVFIDGRKLMNLYKLELKKDP